MRIPQFPFPAIPGIPFISKLFQFVAALEWCVNLTILINLIFGRFSSIWPNCVPLAPTHSSHSLLNRQRFVEVDLCWPLHARLAYIYLPSSLPFPLTYYVVDYYLQCRLRKTNSFEKCLQEPFLVFAQLLTLSKLGRFITHTKAKGANLQNNVFAQFPGSPPHCKKASLDAYIAFASAFWSH